MMTVKETKEFARAERESLDSRLRTALQELARENLRGPVDKARSRIADALIDIVGNMSVDEMLRLRMLFIRD